MTVYSRLEDLYSLLHYIQLEPWGKHHRGVPTLQEWPRLTRVPMTGNFSFFKTFVTVPFQNKDPRAIQVIQVILESIREFVTKRPVTLPREIANAPVYNPTVLRREKKMRDKDGNPIVSLPEKHIDIVHLDFSKDEREIYDALFQNAKSKFLGYAKEGTVLQNVTAIFSILMRLRQAVLHPSLVLKRLKENLRIRQAQRAAGHVGSEDADGGVGPIEDVAIQRMIERYIAGSADAGSEAAASQVIDEMLDIDSSHGVKPELGECMLCMEVSSKTEDLCREVVELKQHHLPAARRSPGLDAGVPTHRLQRLRLAAFD